MQNFDWQDIRFAAEVFRAGTLSAAAANLGVNQTTVARRLARLEKVLQMSLFVRIGGKLQPSREGLPVLEKADDVVSSVRELVGSVNSGESILSGTIRVTAVDPLLADFLVPNLQSFADEYPRINLELIGTGANLDLESQEADIALRLARPLSGNDLVRKVADIWFAIFASPQLIARAGTDNIHALPWITYDSGLDGLPESQWISTNIPDARIQFRFSGGLAMRDAIRSGLGIGLLPYHFGHRSKDLVALGDPVVQREVWMLTNGQVRRTARLEAVAEWLVGIFRANRTATNDPSL